MNDDATILETLLQTITKIPDDDLDTVISYGALKYDDNTVSTVSFAFWICYMAEQDLGDVIEKAWALSKLGYPENCTGRVLSIIKNEYGIKLHKIDPDDDAYNKRDISFGDRIKIEELMFGETKMVELLWKLKNIRDDLSHGRIVGLAYDGESLFLRSTKEKLVIDYFTYSLLENKEDSPIWKKLTFEEKTEIEKKFEEVLGKISDIL